jgi:transcriptional regulator with XRE-family HTH domain
MTMSTTPLSPQEQARAERMRERLKQDGRSQTWVAEATGFSRSYVNKVLHGYLPMSERFTEKFAEAVGDTVVVSEHFRGQTVRIPASVVRQISANGIPFTPDEVASVYKQAWKDAWVREHGSAVLTDAAEAAFILAEKIRAAR